MDEIIEIRLYEESFLKDGISKEDYNNVITTYYSSYKAAIDFVKESGLWTDTIKKVIITNNYYDDIKKQADEWNISVSFANHKEYYGVSKCLSNKSLANRQQYIYFPAMFIPDEEIWKPLVYIQLTRPWYEEHLPSEFQPYLAEKPPLENFYDYIKFGIATWCPSLRVEDNKVTVFGQQKDSILTEEQLFNFFARKLKKHLFEYNSDGSDDSRITQFWNSVFITFTNFILRVIQARVNKGELCFSDPSLNELIRSILTEVEKLDEAFCTGKNFEIASLTEVALNFFKYFGIEISQIEQPHSFYINLPKNPKEYFKGVLVDTEPRIVCFMDILGFSKMIDEYEENETSTVLQDIQKAFKQAMEILRMSNQYGQNKEQIEFLEYKTFSDNICISLPYFDNETDFLANLNIVITFIRGLQYCLMNLGFFTRGGLSMGSYYSDENIIFSKAMVEAYHIESKKAKFPRVVIDEKILFRLQTIKTDNLQYYNLQKAIITEKGTAFLNPFELLNSTKEMVKSMFNAGKLEQDDYDLLSGIISPLMSMMENITMLQLDNATGQEAESYNVIEKIVSGKLDQYKHDKNTYVKYLWLKLLIDWIRSNDKMSRRFSYLNLAELPKGNTL